MRRHPTKQESEHRIQTRAWMKALESQSSWHHMVLLYSKSCYLCFYTYAYLCIHSPDQDMEHFHHPGKLPHAPSYSIRSRSSCNYKFYHRILFSQFLILIWMKLYSILSFVSDLFFSLYICNIHPFVICSNRFFLCITVRYSIVLISGQASWECHQPSATIASCLV